MCRSYLDRPVDGAVLDGLLHLAQRAPAAGNTQGWQWLVLDQPASVARYWDVCLPPSRRAGFPWPGLLRAPVLVIPYADPGAYLARYGEADKAARVAAPPEEREALAGSTDAWAVPYWHLDTAMAAMTLLLGVGTVGLGACLFGQFNAAGAVRAEFGVPDGLEAIGTIAVGHPDGSGQPSASAARRRPPLEQVLHRNGWT